MKTQEIVIIGAGGFGREVLDVFDAANFSQPVFDMIGYIVDPRYGKAGTVINEKPILGDFDWLAGHKDEVQAICAVGAPELRRRLIERAKKTGVKFCNIVHPNVRLTRWITIGEDVVITAGCILTNQIHIGSHVHINLDCTIGHDVIIEDFVTLAPGVHVSGNVILGEGCYIGTGTNIIEGKRIGPWSIIGAGSTIVRDIPENTIAVGVPGKVIKNRAAGWHLK